MKKYKIYTEGNYFYMVDIITGKEYEAHKKEVEVLKDTKYKTIYQFKNVKGLKDMVAVKLANIQKKDGSSYTREEFETFYKEETGNFNIPGAPGASAYEVWLSEGNTGTEQEFFESLQGLPGQGSAPVDITWAQLVALSTKKTGDKYNITDSKPGYPSPMGNIILLSETAFIWVDADDFEITVNIE